jgi:hypothetical protein
LAGDSVGAGYTITAFFIAVHTILILLHRCLESITIIFSCGDSKNHSWLRHSTRDCFRCPTRENNVLCSPSALAPYTAQYYIDTRDRPPVSLLLCDNLKNRVIFDLEAFCSGNFCWEAFDRVLLTGGFLFGGF